MNIIETKKRSKIYRRVVKQEGMGGSIKSLFKREYEEETGGGGNGFRGQGRRIHGPDRQYKLGEKENE